MVIVSMLIGHRGHVVYSRYLRLDQDQEPRASGVPDVRWVTFRYEYLQSTEQYSDKDNLFSGDDYTSDVMGTEFGAALQALDYDHLNEFFFFDESRAVHRCPHCLQNRRGDDACNFVQLIEPDKLQCIVCLSSYSIADYKQKIIDYFGYLDAEEQDQIKNELDECDWQERFFPITPPPMMD